MEEISKNFIEAFIDEDIAPGGQYEGMTVHTRFPPEDHVLLNDFLPGFAGKIRVLIRLTHFGGQRGGGKTQKQAQRQ